MMHRYGTVDRKSLKKVRDAANRALNELNRYFDSVPITDLIEACERAGFDIAEEEKMMILTGREGRTTGSRAAAVPLRLGGVGIDNTLVFFWYKMGSGKYEVTTYVS